jgi:hypothetical protein
MKERPAAERTADVLKIISQRRVEFTERYHDVVESPWLIPTDTLGSAAGKIRLNADCTIEDSSKKFLGED